MSNLYIDQYDTMAKTVNDSLNKQLETINTKNKEAVDAENKAYQDDLTAFSDYWNKKLSVTQTELQTIDQKITEFYNKQIKDVQDSTQKQIDALETGYDKELTDFGAFWDTKLGIHNTELDKVEGAITSYYNQEISDTQSNYQTFIDETNGYYDDLQAATDAGLAKIRPSQADLDALELTMLQEKQGIQAEYDKGLISKEDYEQQLSTLSKAYNAQRSQISDDFRLQELIAEKENKEASATIATEREAAVTSIKTKESTDIAGIEVKKNTDLQTAQTQYSQITQTDFQALTNAITLLKKEEAREVNLAETKKNADLKTAADQFTDMQTAHYNSLITLANQKATDIANAEKAAADQKRKDLQNYRGPNQRQHEPFS